MRQIGWLIAITACLAAAPARADEPSCKSAYGQTACGFECVAAYGEVKCARTRFGVCHAAYGKVACWDPPRFLVRRRAVRPGDARCVAGYGTIGCGFNCVSAYGVVKCSRTPQGRCLAAYSKVVCGDPPRRMFRRGRPRQLECKAGYGDVACGYGCVAAYGQVKCSRTPAGRCQASGGSVVCWDPR